MNTSKVCCGLLVALCAASGATIAQAAAGDSAYAIDGRGTAVRSGANLCWRTGYWTPAMASAECDPDLVKKPAAAPAPAAPPARAPAAAPAAAPAPAPAAAPAPAPKPIRIAAKSLFDFNKATLKADAKAVLDAEVLAKLSRLKEIRTIIVSGHTDRLGSAVYNQKLSERRAEAVKAYLVSKGVKADLIETYGFGKTQAVPGVKCSDTLPRKQLIACLEPNRRVVVEVKGK
ncbi:MAG: hypothetical protein OHK0026_12760 [Rhodocyclaceae bacterium]